MIAEEALKTLQGMGFAKEDAVQALRVSFYY